MVQNGPACKLVSHEPVERVEDKVAIRDVAFRKSGSVAAVADRWCTECFVCLNLAERRPDRAQAGNRRLTTYCIFRTSD